MDTSSPVSNPSILLMGFGFTLSRVGADLPAGSVAVTSTSDQKILSLRRRYPHAHLLDLRHLSGLEGILKRYPALSVAVDGTPPESGATAERIGTSAVERARLLRSSGVTRLIYISTSGVYGESRGGWVNEETAPHPKFDRGRARLAVESAYRSVYGDGLTVIRAPAIYGPGRGVGHSIKARRYRMVEGGTFWTNRIHVADLARAIAKLLEGRRSLPVLALSDGTPAQACDVAAYYCKLLNLPLPPSISYEEALAAKLDSLLSNQRIDSKASWSSLGLTPNFPDYVSGAVDELSIP